MFLNRGALEAGSWQGFERAVSRLLLYEGFQGVRLVGQTGDRGADVLAHGYGKRWLFQVKHWRNRVGSEVVNRTLDAMREYRAHVPVIVSLSGFDQTARNQRTALLSHEIPLQLWDVGTLVERASRLDRNLLLRPEPRAYQEEAIRLLVQQYEERDRKNACLVVMATGLGKTLVAAEAIRRMATLAGRQLRILGIAHTNDLVYQLDRAFWPLIAPTVETLVWNGYERPTLDAMERSPLIFACINSVAEHVESGRDLPDWDVVLIDECHHVGGSMYPLALRATQAGRAGGPFLVGLTATPWRADQSDIGDYFGDPLVTVDIVTGLRKGFLVNVDYRMYTDNIDWDAIRQLDGAGRLSPRQVNRSVFFRGREEGVTQELASVWQEQRRPRAIVFCSTIEHAQRMKHTINSFAFCNAEAVFSSSGRHTMSAFERNRVLCDFQDGIVNVVCAVDIFNEGIDVPDVNIIVFDRVTHSRRIFVQQLGRGLRIAPDKERVIVLDFVSDIRRFAAGLRLQNELGLRRSYRDVEVRLPHRVTFRRIGGDDPATELFLRRWLEDVAEIEEAGDDASVLKFPPNLPS